jgi:hypothetical protein
VVQRAVDADSVEPGVELRAPPESGKRSVGLDEDLLRQIIGIVAIPDEGVYHVVDLDVMVPDESTERVPISFSGACYEFRLIVLRAFSL